MKHVAFSTGIGHMEFINRRTRIGIEDYIEDRRKKIYRKSIRNI